jgi:hypothetical protein
MVVTDVWQAKPLGTFSLAGSQMKASMILRHKLACVRCGWSVIGWIKDGHFYGKPEDQTPGKEAPPSPHPGDGAEG